MGKANATIYAAAALGLCLMSPHGAAAAPATPDMGKAYTQAANGENSLVARPLYRPGWLSPVRGRGRAPLWHRTRFRLRPRTPRLLGRPRLHGGYYGLGRGLGYGYRRAYWGGGGGWGPGYGLGLGWGWPVGLGLGLGVAATDWGFGGGWGYPGYYGGYAPAYFGGGGCYGW